MEKKKSTWWLYVLVALCLAFSGFMVLRLTGRLQQYDESKQSYQELGKEAVATGSVTFPDELAVQSASLEGQEEEESDQDQVLFLINSDSLRPEDIGITPEFSQATVAPNVTDVPVAQANATVAPNVTDVPVAQANATLAPNETDAPVAQANTTLAPNETDAAVVQAKATLAPNTTDAPIAQANVTAQSTDEPTRARTVEMDSVHYSVDFGYLQSINADVAGWLIQDGTIINYPVMQAKNNEYYLTHLFNRNYNTDGSLFMDCGNSAYFIDANTYIYGHHTKSGSMFSTLAEYATQDYYDLHPQMILLTPYSDYCVDLFACRVSLVDDESSWRVKQFTRKDDFDQYITGLVAESLFRCKEDSLPEWGDQLLVLCTCTNIEHKERYVLYGRMRPIAYTTDNQVTITKMNMDAKATASTVENVPGRGEMQVYAQNDELWARMRYDQKGSDNRRYFGDGGCGPTAVAMAIVNMVPEEKLPDLYGYGSTYNGFTFCECSVNQYFCNRKHAQYQVRTADEYRRYFPVVMASFATGNNVWGEASRTKRSGTNMKFLKNVCYAYELELTGDKSLDVALEAVGKGGLAVCSLGKKNPFTKGSHYVVLASADADYLYFLDPYRKSDYSDTDAKGVLTQIAPGVIRARREDARALDLYAFYIISEKAE